MRRHYPRITEVYHNLHSPQKRLRIKRTRSFVNVYGSLYLRGGNSVMFEPSMFVSLSKHDAKVLIIFLKTKIYEDFTQKNAHYKQIVHNFTTFMLY